MDDKDVEEMYRLLMEFIQKGTTRLDDPVKIKEAAIEIVVALELRHIGQA